MNGLENLSFDQLTYLINFYGSEIGYTIPAATPANTKVEIYANSGKFPQLVQVSTVAPLVAGGAIELTFHVSAAAASGFYYRLDLGPYTAIIPSGYALNASKPFGVGAAIRLSIRHFDLTPRMCGAKLNEPKRRR